MAVEAKALRPSRIEGFREGAQRRLRPQERPSQDRPLARERFGADTNAPPRCPARAETTRVVHVWPGTEELAAAAAQPSSLGTVTFQLLLKKRSPSTVTSTVVEKR